jgi:hypothetical protein
MEMSDGFEGVRPSVMIKCERTVWGYGNNHSHDAHAFASIAS